MLVEAALRASASYPGSWMRSSHVTLVDARAGSRGIPPPRLCLTYQHMLAKMNASTATTAGWCGRMAGWFCSTGSFYPFNNWRSGFFGVNDHEADWEMISIYCSEDEPRPGPSQVVGLCGP
jgi:hypothetical protein